MNNAKPHAGLFMLVFLFCALLSGIWGVWNSYNDTQPVKTTNFFNGKWTTLYERTFDKSLHFNETSKNFWGILNYVLFNQGRDGVIIGQDDWLFTSEEFTFPRNAKANIEDNIDYIRDVNAFLKSKNIEILVTIIPAKARVYKEYLSPYRYPEAIEPLYHDIRKAMKDGGIPVTDILWIMDKKKEDFELFLKTDTHWTPAGSKISARQIASKIKTDFKHLDFPQTIFISEQQETVKHEGDLMRYIPLGDLERKLGPEHDDLKIVKTDKITDLENEKTEDAALSLFSDEVIPVTLVGTSYSANPLWNFDGFLKEALNVDILNAADEGKGPFETMEAYLKDDAFKTNPPMLVIWEIPERYVSVKYDLETP